MTFGNASLGGADHALPESARREANQHTCCSLRASSTNGSRAKGVQPRAYHAQASPKTISPARNAMSPTMAFGRHNAPRGPPREAQAAHRRLGMRALDGPRATIQGPWTSLIAARSSPHLKPDGHRSLSEARRLQSAQSAGEQGVSEAAAMICHVPRELPRKIVVARDLNGLLPPSALPTED